MRAKYRLICVALLVLSCTVLPSFAGDLTPPDEAFAGGQPAAFMKSIDEVEPRVIIQSLPYIITNSGSYYLAKNLYGTVSNSVGIQIECDDVQLDLNGFALIGRKFTQDGIRVVGTNENVNIRHGSIRQWDGFGINAPDANDGAVIDVKANRNGLGGIVFGESARIEGCSTYGNGFQAPLPPGFTSGDPNATTDNDMLPDSWEMQIVNFYAADSITSVWEVLAWYQPDPTPTNFYDFDMDGAFNGDEFNNNTDPTDPNNGGFNTFMDMDCDSMDDNWESNMIFSVSAVDEVDGLDDVWDYYDPMKITMPPWNAATNITIFYDFDLDGAPNKEEFNANTDPANSNDFPAGTSGGSGSYTDYSYTNYTAPDDVPVVEGFEDPMDEPGDDGIRVGSLSTVIQCKSRDNRGSGIYARFASRVISCISAGNKTDGIRVSNYCTVRDCTAARNRMDGIVIVSHCCIQENNCGQNGDFARVNTAVPEGAGIRIFGSGNRIENNNVSGNALGIEVDPALAGMGLTAGRNLIIGNSSVDNWGKAFDLGTGDYMGGHSDSQSYGDATSTTNALMDGNNPFSNFSM